MNPFSYTRAVVYLLVIAVIVIGGFLALSFIRLDRQQDAQAEATSVPFVACNFTNTGGEPIDVYSAPFAADMLAIDSIAPSVPYPVTLVNTTGFLFIQLRGDYGGYVDQFRGLATGDCELVPREERPPWGFPTVCMLETPEPAPVTLYAGPELTTTRGEVNVAAPLIVSARQGDALFVTTVGGSSGWLTAATGTLSGACGVLPEAP
ncbi:MAG: hypothetical protein ACOCXZ_03035 [Chloroflexota bacterium]